MHQPRDSGLPFPRNGVRYTEDEPHPYIPMSHPDYGVLCEVCGVQPHDGHPYPPSHPFQSYTDYTWRVCVHCGEQRVNTMHPTEKTIVCNTLGVIRLAGMSTSHSHLNARCTMDLERYPHHHHQVRVVIYDANGIEQEGSYVTWRTRDRITKTLGATSM